MSDNISPEEIKKRLVLFLSIPAEVWTDVLKLFSRRTLVQQIAPNCYKFKEISNKNVKNVHVIKHAGQFTRKLNEDDPEANQQLEQLAGSKCQLANHFRLTYLWIFEKSKDILRHCPDLFNGCNIALFFREENKDPTLFLETLGYLERAKPAEIRVIQRVGQCVDYWHHPTFQHNTRVDLDFWPHLQATILMTIFENIYDWLHHKPIGINCDASADQYRCMIICWNFPQNHIDWLVNRCSEDIQQAQEVTDRRPFVLSFHCPDWPGFGQFRRIENQSTGEVLTLERKMRASGQATDHYRLRRCLAEEEANGEEFYAEMFEKGYGIDAFDIGEKTPYVMIE